MKKRKSLKLKNWSKT